MYNLIFNVEHEIYCLHFRPGGLSVKKALLMQLKIFGNILGLTCLISLPIASMMLVAKFLDSL